MTDRGPCTKCGAVPSVYYCWNCGKPLCDNVNCGGHSVTCSTECEDELNENEDE